MWNTDSEMVSANSVWCVSDGRPHRKLSVLFRILFSLLRRADAQTASEGVTMTPERHEQRSEVCSSAGWGAGI